jgi:hypothetical protein
MAEKIMKKVTVKGYLEKVNTKDISTEVAVQRGDDQWKDAQKGLLISSVMKGFPIPPVCTVEFNGETLVIDGLQRTTALQGFYNNEFTIEGSHSELDGKKYDELSEEDRNKFDNYEMNIEELRNVTKEELSEVFICLNSGKPVGTVQKLKGYAGYENANFINKMCKSDLLTKQADFTDMQKRNSADIECIIQGMILVDAYFNEVSEEPYNWKNISRKEQESYCENVLSNRTAEELKKYEDIIAYASSIGGNKIYKKTMIPAIIFLAKVAMMSEVTVEEFDKYVTKMVKDKPAAYETNMGSGNVSKKSTVGRIKALFDDFKKEYPKKVTMELDFDTSNKKKVDKAKTKDSKKKATKSKTVADKETTEVSANSEATKDTAEVASTDISSDNGVSSEATADASSDTSVATNEDSASDSSEADAEPAKDVSDGTEVVA